MAQHRGFATRLLDWTSKLMVLRGLLSLILATVTLLFTVSRPPTSCATQKRKRPLSAGCHTIHADQGEQACVSSDRCFHAPQSTHPIVAKGHDAARPNGSNHHRPQLSHRVEIRTEPIRRQCADIVPAHGRPVSPFQLGHVVLRLLGGGLNRRETRQE